MLSTMQKPPHIVAVSETKINKNDGLSFPNTITGYNFLHSDSEKNQVEHEFTLIAVYPVYHIKLKLIYLMYLMILKVSGLKLIFTKNLA